MPERPHIPSMTSASVLDFLTALGARWKGRGVAVECGSWLGASAVALATGLVQAGYDRPLHCFDRWRATRSEIVKAAKAGATLRVGQNLEPLFRANVEPIYRDLVTYRGWIHEAKWTGGPIEFFILDAAKSNPAFTRVLRMFEPSWIPGVTIIGLMDCRYGRRLTGPKASRYRDQEAFVATQAEVFERVAMFPNKAPVFFRYVKEIDWK